MCDLAKAFSKPISEGSPACREGPFFLSFFVLVFFSELLSISLFSVFFCCFFMSNMHLYLLLPFPTSFDLFSFFLFFHWVVHVFLSLADQKVPAFLSFYGDIFPPTLGRVTVVANGFLPIQYISNSLSLSIFCIVRAFNAYSRTNCFSRFNLEHFCLKWIESAKRPTQLYKVHSSLRRGLFAFSYFFVIQLKAYFLLKIVSRTGPWRDWLTDCCFFLYLNIFLWHLERKEGGRRKYHSAWLLYSYAHQYINSKSRI